MLVSNIYWIQLVALQSFASFPHSSDKAFTLLDGAWTSLQALYMAEKSQIRERKPRKRGTVKIIMTISHRITQLKHSYDLPLAKVCPIQYSTSTTLGPLTWVLFMN